jgi:hypothetical protein
LSEFLEAAHQNRFATFANKPDQYLRLTQIDKCFARIGDGWMNPPNLVPPLLFFRSHAAFRAACEHAMAGQIIDTFVSIRALIETAGYALHIHRNPSLEEVWLRRHDDESCEKKVKQEFKISKVRESIRASDREGVKIFAMLYERSIDFGAHPNERAVTGSMSVSKADSSSNYKLLLLQGDGLPLDHALKSAAQAGVCALEILGNVFSARYELLGVREKLPLLKNGL